MAKSEATDPAGGLREHELIARLVPDPAAPPVYAVFRGFLGRSSEPGHWRLYFTPDLAFYVEVLEPDIAHVAEEVAEEPGRGPGIQTVWVKREAILRYTRELPRRAQADFLRGEISAGLLRVAQVSGDLFTQELEGSPHTRVAATCTLAFSCLTQPVCT